MKKGIIAVAALLMLTAGVATAQDQLNGGRFSMEVGFTPNLNGSNFFNLPYGIAGTYRLNNGHKLYVGLKFNHESETNGAIGLDKDNPNFDLLKENYNRSSQTVFSLTAGYMHYFKKEGRLRPYGGGFVSFTRQFASYKEVYNGEEDGKWYNHERTIKGFDNDDCFASFALGICGSLGFDYYITKGIYIGAEVMLSANYESFLDLSAEYTTTFPSEKNQTNDIDVNQKTSNIGTSITTTICLGWEF
ncbi:MAG: outer membrane beta-barrel protein [Bacteroidales bacterium]|nr:outer membrane beta-barrel protein [Candidatus Colimorpha onthohippi]